MKERILLAGLLFVFGLLSCKKDIDSTPPSPPPPQADTVTILKNAVDFPIGFAVDYTLFKNNAVYAGIVAREADRITFENHLKHGMLVADDGTINYSRADELLQLATNAGLSVYGHTLVWHEGQNSNYLRSLTVGVADPTAENLLPEGGFENGTGRHVVYRVEFANRWFVRWQLCRSYRPQQYTGPGSHGDYRRGKSLGYASPRSCVDGHCRQTIRCDG
jgi:endo-1,4-beta-xylanase